MVPKLKIDGVDGSMIVRMTTTSGGYGCSHRVLSVGAEAASIDCYLLTALRRVRWSGPHDAVKRIEH